MLSNPESGYGRCDVLVTPRQPGRPGLVLELKVRDADRGETVEQAQERAFRQLGERDFAAGLRARGASLIHELALIFDGKRVHARRRPIASGLVSRAGVVPRGGSPSIFLLRW